MFDNYIFFSMKKLLLFAVIFFVSLATQAQTLKTGDVVSISFKNTPWNVLDYYTYMEASTSGILSKTYATDDCLWELEVSETSNGYQYAFKDLTTEKYLAVNYTANNQETLKLSEKGAQGTLFSFTETEGEEGKYMYGQLYYNTVTHWGQAMPLWVSEYGGIFMVANWSAYDLYIEKWEQKGAGKPTGHFCPSKIEFSYIGDQEGDLETDDDPRPVQFMIEATTESYYKCIRRPDEALLRRTTGNVDGNQITIKSINWESDSINNGKVSKLDVSKYINCPEPNGRAIMSLSQPTTAQDGKWQFTITPEGLSPMGLKQTIYEETVDGATVGIDRWVDYADNVVVEYQYGNSESQKAKMRVVRKSYRKEELPTLTFSINPLTYTFNPEQESKVFTVVATHQHGDAIYNVDNQIIDTTFTVRPEKIALTDANLTLTPGADWLSARRDNDTDDKIIVTAAANNGSDAKKRSAILTGTLTPQREGKHEPVDFIIPLDQRAHVISGGIQFVANSGQSGSPLKDGRQQVHTVEKTIYYTPDQAEIELRLQESGYSGYMRWYDYETGGDPYYNYTHEGKQATSWVRSPRGNQDKAFSAINTPKDGESETIAKEGHSHGLYSLNKADGGALDEDNPYNPNPILKPWEDGKYHIMACDVSAYTDYEVKKDQYGQITSITEPTLSYRQIFHLRPAEEMANKFAALGENEYLEEYKYQAPAGKQILLATEYRYKKFRSHLSEMCYFYWANGDDNQTWIDRVVDYTPVVWKEYIKNADGTLTLNPNFVAKYSAEMDYLIVRSDVYPATKVYTLELPGGNGSWVDERYTNGLRIARFEVEFVDIEKQGPTPQTIITQQRINSQYKTLAEINFDNITTHLPWEQASYGYVYETEPLNEKYKRGASQGCFPFYGEYTVLESVNKDWAKGTAHGETGKALYVDGTMEPGLVASIKADATICTGQTMYCSAWFCNPTPSGWSGEGNPIFRCNIQGKHAGETEWHDAGVYFVGELLKGTGWQQIVFPIESAHTYDSTRVSIYNFATTNQGNDFMVDDITLYVTQLPIAAYQGKTACRSTGDGNTTAAAILRLDYSNITAGSDGYMYYQIYNESFDLDNDNVADGAPVNLTGNAAYYHDNEAHNGGVHEHSYGSVTIPAADFDPERYNASLLAENNNRTDTLLIYKSVSKLLDEMASSGSVREKAYIKTNNNGVIKWLLYVAHLVPNVSETEVKKEDGSGSELPLQMLYDQHDYTMRMAYSPAELAVPACNMQTPIHATQKTIFRLRNSDGHVIMHDQPDSEKKDLLVATKNQSGVRDITRLSTENCANDLYFLTAKVINHMSLSGTGSTTQDLEAPIYADWLVGEDFDDVYNNGRPATGSKEKIKADSAFVKKYGYTRGQIASAVMYDMRRVPTDDEPNPNYFASSLKELLPSAFESYQNYEIVKHLCDSGWLQMRDTTVYFYLGGPQTTARYWCFPIDGTAKYNESVTLKDCNEPRWVSISSQSSPYFMNITPIANNKKTNQQKTQIPAVKVLEGGTDVLFAITELSNKDREPNVSVENMLEINRKKVVRLNLDNPTFIFMNMEIGVPYRNNPKIEPGKEYVVRLQLTDNNGWTNIDNNESNCRVGYVFMTLQIVPKTLVWTPDGTTFTGWGINDNWKGWVDKNNNWQIDVDTVNYELIDAFVPISGTNVIIPKLDNPLAYPYIVPDGDTEHKHTHYPMTVDFQPHHCENIYFAHEAIMQNQHLLHYERAFVDMQLQAGNWHMMSAPLQDMYSGDMFIPHSGGANVESQNPFEVSNFRGKRSGTSTYAFWASYYNQTVNTWFDNGTTEEVAAAAEFHMSNGLNQKLEPASGYLLWGEGPEKDLVVRLPKPDNMYYSSGGNQVPVQRTNSGKFAFTATHENQQMNITLTNKVASKYFVFGNPTMAYINMAQFLQEHSSVLTGNVYRIDNGSWTATAEQTMRSNEKYLAPMTSVMLEARAEQTSLNLTLRPSVLTLNDQVAAQSPVRRVQERRSTSTSDSDLTSEILTIYAITPNAHARTLIATHPEAYDYYVQSEDALLMTSGVQTSSYVTIPLNLYTAAEQVPMMADVRQGVSRIPLSMIVYPEYRTDYMQLAFYLSSNWTRECYIVDSYTGQRIRIMDGLIISVEMPKDYEERYFIEGPDEYLGAGNNQGDGTTTNLDNATTAEPMLRAYSVETGQLTVSASEPIREMKVYSITGQLLYTTLANCQLSTIHCQVPSGACIVEAKLHSGNTLHQQAIVK